MTSNSIEKGVPAAAETSTSANGEASAATPDTMLKRNRTEGYVIECNGERAIIAAHAGATVTASDDYWAVGQLISLRVGKSRIIGLIYSVDARGTDWQRDGENIVHIHIELVGEIGMSEDGKEHFSTGIVNYPYMGAVAHRIRAADLATVYASSSSSTVSIGHLSQDSSLPALITIDTLLSRHFAVVGTTGVGKSTAVTLLLRKVVEARPDIRVVLLDPHNEFRAAFHEQAIVVDSTSLELPFWMFQLDEFAEVIYRGRPIIPEEVDLLRDLIPMAKEKYAAEDPSAQTLVRKRDRENNSLTADTPVPYRMMDLIKALKDKEGQLDAKNDRPTLKSLRNRLEAILQDSRFRFMFQPKTPGDILEKTISHLFRIPANGKPICVFEMSGLPSEVTNSVVSVVSRYAFDLAVSSDGSVPILLVCEEAHRYIPADPNAGFWPTKNAIARIAKEGRKYGVFLSVITQRPGELDPTILSQCNTIFAMRLGNESDKEIIRQAISGAAKSTTNFLSSIANREAIAFGEAVPTPMRMKFETVIPASLPGSSKGDPHPEESVSTVPLRDVIRRMRKQDQQPIFSDYDEVDATSFTFVGESTGNRNARRADISAESSTYAVLKPETAAPQPIPQPGASQNLVANSINRSVAPRRFGQDAPPARQPEASEQAGSSVSRERASDLVRNFRTGRI